MWAELNLERMATQEHVEAGAHTVAEVEKMLVMVHLELYNVMLPCGFGVFLRRLADHYSLTPPPSERIIGQILSRHGLTHRSVRDFTMAIHRLMQTNSDNHKGTITKRTTHRGGASPWARPSPVRLAGTPLGPVLWGALEPLERLDPLTQKLTDIMI